MATDVRMGNGSFDFLASIAALSPPGPPDERSVRYSDIDPRAVVPRKNKDGTWPDGVNKYLNSQEQRLRPDILAMINELWCAVPMCENAAQMLSNAIRADGIEFHRHEVRGTTLLGLDPSFQSTASEHYCDAFCNEVVQQTLRCGAFCTAIRIIQTNDGRSFDAVPYVPPIGETFVTVVRLGHQLVYRGYWINPTPGGEPAFWHDHNLTVFVPFAQRPTNIANPPSPLIYALERANQLLEMLRHTVAASKAAAFTPIILSQTPGAFKNDLDALKDWEGFRQDIQLAVWADKSTDPDGACSISLRDRSSIAALASLRREQREVQTDPNRPVPASADVLELGTYARDAASAAMVTAPSGLTPSFKPPPSQTLRHEDIARQLDELVLDRAGVPPEIHHINRTIVGDVSAVQKRFNETVNFYKRVIGIHLSRMESAVRQIRAGRRKLERLFMRALSRPAAALSLYTAKGADGLGAGSGSSSSSEQDNDAYGANDDVAGQASGSETKRGKDLDGEAAPRRGTRRLKLKEIRAGFSMLGALPPVSTVDYYLHRRRLSKLRISIVFPVQVTSPSELVALYKLGLIPFAEFAKRMLRFSGLNPDAAGVLTDPFNDEERKLLARMQFIDPAALMPNPDAPPGMSLDAALLGDPAAIKPPAPKAAE